MKVTILFFTALFLTFQILISLSLSQEAGKMNISVEEYREKIFILSIEEENNILFLGENGNIIIANGHNSLSKDLFKKIKEINNRPIKYIIYSHIHTDDLKSDSFPDDISPTLIFQENAFERLSRKVEKRLSLITFGSNLSIQTDEEEISLMHYPNAHTDSDITVYFKNSDILFTGNLFYTKSFPFIDINSGGTIKGYLDAVNTINKLAGKKTEIVPGTGAVTNRKELEQFQKMFKNSKNRIELMVHAEKSLKDIIEDNPLDDFKKIWESGKISSLDFTKNLFDGLSNRN